MGLGLDDLKKNIDVGVNNLRNTTEDITPEAIVLLWFMKRLWESYN